jgi:hypothetical protein
MCVLLGCLRQKLLLDMLLRRLHWELSPSPSLKVTFCSWESGLGPGVLLDVHIHQWRFAWWFADRTFSLHLGSLRHPLIKVLRSISVQRRLIVFPSQGNLTFQGYVPGYRGALSALLVSFSAKDVLIIIQLHILNKDSTLLACLPPICPIQTAVGPLSAFIGSRNQVRRPNDAELRIDDPSLLPHMGNSHAQVVVLKMSARWWANEFFLRFSFAYSFIVL